mmetsp:Transcript_11638/g.18007  ORF Transcript_11638/g.18007 Transcript_11638/m.18007 type:complete len:142 (+) Transcript_11638:237-662(+)
MMTKLRFEFLLTVFALKFSFTNAQNENNSRRTNSRNDIGPLRQHHDMQEGSLFGYSFSDDYLFGTEQPSSLHSFPAPIPTSTSEKANERDNNRKILTVSSTTTKKISRRGRRPSSPENNADITKPVVHRTTKRTTFLPYIP